MTTRRGVCILVTLAPCHRTRVEQGRLYGHRPVQKGERGAPHLAGDDELYGRRLSSLIR